MGAAHRPDLDTRAIDRDGQPGGRIADDAGNAASAGDGNVDTGQRCGRGRLQSGAHEEATVGVSARRPGKCGIRKLAGFRCIDVNLKRIR